MPSMIGGFDTLKSAAGKIFSYLASITLTGTDGKTITVTQDTSLDEAVAMSSKATQSVGNWTPTFNCGTSGTITITGGQIGSYIKTGRLVVATVGFDVSAISSPVGRLTIGGLPFTVSNALKYAGAFTVAMGPLNALATGQLIGTLILNNTIAYIDRYLAGTIYTDVASYVLANTSGSITIIYTTD